MKTHLLRVESGADDFAPLFAAAREAGLRIGWLELGVVVAPPDSLSVAASYGALRAVAVGEHSSVSVKPRRGGPVLKDVVREHFTGCALVLAQSSGWTLGGEEPPVLRAGGDSGEWEVMAPQHAVLRLSTADLLGALRRPRPWDR